MSDVRRGVAPNGRQLEYELGSRGLQAKELAALAGVSEHLVSRARRGVPIAPESQIAQALAATDASGDAGSEEARQDGCRPGVAR